MVSSSVLSCGTIYTISILLHLLFSTMITVEVYICIHIVFLNHLSWLYVIMYIEIKNIFMLVKIFVCCIFIETKYIYYRNTDPRTGYTVLHIDV